MVTAVYVRDPARDAAYDGFADITTAPVLTIEWTTPRLLRIRFDGALTAAQQVQVQQRVLARDAADESVRMASVAWLTSLSSGTPSTTSIVEQLQRVTRLLLGGDLVTSTPTSGNNSGAGSTGGVNVGVNLGVATGTTGTTSTSSKGA